MEWAEIGRFIFALLLVIGLIGLSALVFRKLGLEKKWLGQRGAGRIKVEETFYIDGKRKLVLLRRDNVGHLLLLGGAQDVVIESGIPLPSEKAHA